MAHIPNDEILIRRAYADDGVDLLRLAALDSAPLPPGPLLLAEIDGVLSAALSLRDGSAIADPFRRTAEVLELLRLHAVTGREAAPNRSARALLGRILGPVRWPAL